MDSAPVGRANGRAVPARKKGWVRFLPFFVLAVGTATTVGVSRWQAADYETARETRLADETEDITANILASVEAYEALNTSTAEQARPADGHRTTEQEFATYADGLVLEARFPGTFGVAWADSVPSVQLEQMLSDESLPIASLPDLRPDQSQERSVVVTLGEPSGTMSIARGVDARVFPPISSTLDQAIDQESVRMSEPFALPLRFGPEKDDPPVVVFLARPVFRPDADMSTAAARADAVDGFAAVIVDMDRFLPTAGGPLQNRYAMSVEDVTGSDPIPLAATATKALGGGASRTVDTEFMGREWQIHYQEADLVVYGEQDLATNSFVGGLVLTAFVFMIVFLISRSESRARGLVDRATAELTFRASRDALTQLVNRSELEKQLDLALDNASGIPPTLLFIDLDGFKLVNDSLGHAAGDQLLVAVADRLRAAVRPTDVVARFGGDEFVVLALEVSEHRSAIDLVMRLQRTLEDAFEITGREVFVSCSIGVASDPDGTATAESLIRHADAAMYKAKEVGVGNYAVFEASIHRQAVDRLTLMTDLRHALDRGEIRLEHQPQVDLHTGEISGVESLMRWDHPTRGSVSPEEFIPLAEQSGLIHRLGLWALQQACALGVHWQDLAGGTWVPVSVNVSGHQLVGSQLEADVQAALHSSGLDPRALCLEITESALIRDMDGLADSLARLRGQGIQIAADDFGTGYSSLGQIKRLPVDVLKIDRSFIEGLADGPMDEAIVGAVVEFAHAMGTATVAEGIETEAQRDIVRRLGVDHAQGWLFHRSVSAEAIDALIAREREPEPAAASLSVRLGVDHAEGWMLHRSISTAMIDTLVPDGVREGEADPGPGSTERPPNPAATDPPLT